MKNILLLILSISIISCNSGQFENSKNTMVNIEQSELSNEKIKSHTFLECMYQDSYFPEFLVDKCKNILIALCKNIEESKPKNLDELYVLTHASTGKINNLENEFFENDSEIETAARECLGLDFEYISNAYGFEADVEELIANRYW